MSPLSQLQRRTRTGHTAVLRMVDQQQDRSPMVCVATGMATNHAIKVTAVDLPGTDVWQLLVGSTLTNAVAFITRRPHTRIVLAVEPDTWKTLTRRMSVAVAITCLGLGFLATGIVGGNVGLIVFGAVVAVIGSWRRMRVATSSWIGLRFRSGRGEVLVYRASQRFDTEARKLFTGA